MLIYYIKQKLTSNALQIILANTSMNVGLQLNIQLSQGSAATNVRRDGKFYNGFLYGSSRNTSVKELLKSVHTCQSGPKNKTCMFFYAHRVCTVKHHNYQFKVLALSHHRFC